MYTGNCWVLCNKAILRWSMCRICEFVELIVWRSKRWEWLHWCLKDLTDYTLTFENGRMKVSAHRAFDTGDDTDYVLSQERRVWCVVKESKIEPIEFNLGVYTWSGTCLVSVMLPPHYLDSGSGFVLFHVVSYGFLMCTAMVCWKDTPYYILLTVGQTMGETSAIQVGYHGSASTQTLVCLSTLSQKGWLGTWRRFCVISVHVHYVTCCKSCVLNG